MNVDQYRSVQQRAVDVQRLALELMELGHSKEGLALSLAAVKVLKLKPTKVEPAAPAKAEKGKGA